MPEPKISPNQVEPGSVVLIRGKVAYSRICSHIAGQELADENARARARGSRFDKQRPFTRINIHSAQLIAKNPANLTLAEQCIAGRCYTSTRQERYPGASFSAENSSQYLPAVGVKQPDGSYQQVFPKGEIAAGTDVILVLRFFKGQNNGIALDAVLVQDDHVPVGGSSRLANALADFGVTFTPAEAPDDRDPAQIAAQAAQSLPLGGGMPQAQPAAPVAAVATAPMAAQPAAAPIIGAPVTAAMPQTAVAPVYGGEPAGIMYDPDAQ